MCVYLFEGEAGVGCRFEPLGCWLCSRLFGGVGEGLKMMINMMDFWGNFAELDKFESVVK